MKKALLYNWMVNISLWLLIYGVRTFAYFEFRNPFQWIIDIPIYSVEDRALGLIGILTWQLMQLFFIYDVFVRPKP